MFWFLFIYLSFSLFCLENAEPILRIVFSLYRKQLVHLNLPEKPPRSVMLAQTNVSNATRPVIGAWSAADEVDSFHNGHTLQTDLVASANDRNDDSSPSCCATTSCDSFSFQQFQQHLHQQQQRQHQQQQQQRPCHYEPNNLNHQVDMRSNARDSVLCLKTELDIPSTVFAERDSGTSSSVAAFVDVGSVVAGTQSRRLHTVTAPTNSHSLQSPFRPKVLPTSSARIPLTGCNVSSKRPHYSSVDSLHHTQPILSVFKAPSVENIHQPRFVVNQNNSNWFVSNSTNSIHATSNASLGGRQYSQRYCNLQSTVPILHQHHRTVTVDNIPKLVTPLDHFHSQQLTTNLSFNSRQLEAQFSPSNVRQAAKRYVKSSTRPLSTTDAQLRCDNIASIGQYSHTGQLLRCPKMESDCSDICKDMSMLRMSDSVVGSNQQPTNPSSTINSISTANNSTSPARQSSSDEHSSNRNSSNIATFNNGSQTDQLQTESSNQPGPINSTPDKVCRIFGILSFFLLHFQTVILILLEQLVG